MQISVPQEALDSIVQKAMFEAFGQDQRDKLVMEAIKFLTTPQQHGITRDRSTPIQDAFVIAVRAAAQKLMHRELEDPESEVSKMVHGELRKLLGDFSAVLGDSSAVIELRSALMESMVTKLADMRSEGRY